MSYFGYSPAPSAYNSSTGGNNQILGSPTSSSGGGMSGSTSPSGITTNSNSNNTSSSPPPAVVGLGGQSCCDGGRPLVTDPLTGQPVCSCQYDPARLSLSSYPRLAAAYGSNPYVPASDQNPYPSLESSAFYSPLGGAYAGLKEGSGTGDVSCWPNPGSLQSGYYPYDPTFAAAYGYGGGYDLAARRKNATRESTATLKAWLNEHKKNPYPTKGEKIMLAIITKMTLTQVSTWFANARRRLKKENKMTWEPKNKTDEDDEDMKDDDDDCDSSHGAPSPPPTLPNHNNNNIIRKSEPLGGGLDHLKSSSSDCSGGNPGGVNSTNKPKIWSLADTAACKTPPPPNSSHSHLQHLQGGGGGGPNLNYHHQLNVLNHHHQAQVAAHHQFQQHAANAMVLAQQHPHHHPTHGPPPVTSSWSFPLPPYGRNPYSAPGFLPPNSSEGSTGGGSVGGTETPPQTPPNLKVPLLPGTLGSHYHGHAHPGGPPSHLHHLHHPSLGSSSLDLNPMISGGTSTAFKPVLKSSSGGFCV